MASRRDNPALFATDAEAEPSPAGYVRVALERGIDTAEGGLTYAVPEKLAGLAVGERVRVPLGRNNKPAVGYVVERMGQLDDALQGKAIKPVQSREGSGVSLPAELIELARWVASYYVCPLGMVLATMLPAAVKHGTGTKHRPVVRLVPAFDAEAKPTKLQRAILEAAKHHRDADGQPGWVDLKQLADEAGAKTTGPVKKLIEAGWLEEHRVEVVVGELEAAAQAVAKPSKPLTLTEAQQSALDSLTQQLGSFHVSLLHGITGSGKTEVYLRLIEALLKEHLSDEDEPPGVIVLVPEIALTPQTVSRFLARFVADLPGADAPGVAVLHSGLTAAQRHAQWRRIRGGKARIVVGARSAVFAPLKRVGLILVDEEHDASYKQDQLPRYHARDVAVRRAQLAGCPVVLGSATPSLESYANAHPDPSEASARKYHLLSLPDRVPGAKLPKVELIDLSEERRERRGVHLLSRRLEDHLRRTLADGGQAMLLLNRRGYANYVSCPDHRCGWLMNCEHCDALMVYHVNKDLPTGGLVRCHHCTAEQLMPPSCPDCSRKVTKFGMGTQRIEEELGNKFPDARLARMDADAMRTGKDYQHTLDAFAAGQTDILLGTQMIAKGLDVPNVRLVGVISADTSLNFPDFRSAERTFQLIAQVAGRAGRGEHPGTVVIQTFHPDDQTIRDAAAHDFAGFAQRELQTRQQGNLPPGTRLARIVCRDRDRVATFKRINELSAALHAANHQIGAGVFLTAPAPCPVARVAEHFRFQLELIAPSAAVLQRLLTAVRNHLAVVSDAHTAIDVDPVSLL